MENIIEIKTSEDYNSFVNVKDNVLRVVKLGAEWCGPCRSLSKTILNLDNNKIGSTIFAEINIEDEDIADIVSLLAIRSIPVLLFFKNGNLLEKKVGGISESDLYNMIETYL